jgi:hypothetical protein
MPFELRKRDTYGCTRMPKMTLGVKWLTDHAVEIQFAG